MKNLNQMTNDHCELGNKCEEELDGGGMQSEITEGTNIPLSSRALGWNWIHDLYLVLHKK